MRTRAWLLSLVAVTALSAVGWAQKAEYPITVVAPGKGPYTFPAGYQTPWDRIEIIGDGEDVTESVRAARV